MSYRVVFHIKALLSRIAERLGVGLLAVLEPRRTVVITMDSQGWYQVRFIDARAPFGRRIRLSYGGTMFIPEADIHRYLESGL